MALSWTDRAERYFTHPPDWLTKSDPALSAMLVLIGVVVIFIGLSHVSPFVKGAVVGWVLLP